MKKKGKGKAGADDEGKWIKKIKILIILKWEKKCETECFRLNTVRVMDSRALLWTSHTTGLSKNE